MNAESCRLYLISPPALDLEPFARTLGPLLETGLVGAFQLRLKSPELKEGRLTHDSAEDDAVRHMARRLLPLCRANEVAFILNDSPRLARDIGADGVHLGQEDGSVAEARALIGDEAAVGVSCHDSRHLAMDAGEAGADYVGFGAFYPTQSKTAAALETYGTPTAEIIDWWSTHTVIPCVAIGGMTPENCAPLVAAGADFIAVINAVWNAPDPLATVKRFGQAMAKAAA